MRKHFIALALTLCSIFTSGYAFAADSAAFDPTYIPISAQSSGSSVPVGTVVAWPAALANQSQCVAAVSQEDAQAKGCEWLICDGSSIDSAAYPALTAIVGTSLPNLSGRFLEGASGTVRSYKAAGLPNITGNTYSLQGSVGILQNSSTTSGAFYRGTQLSRGINSDSDNEYALAFDASRSSSIYGNSTTVQPKSYTVNYLIKAY